MSKLSFSLSSVAAIQAATHALAADAKPLLDLAGKAMETIEATSTASGPDKKTAVLNIVGLAAAELGRDFSTIAAEISAFVDGAKALYNAVVAAVTPAPAPAHIDPQA